MKDLYYGPLESTIPKWAEKYYNVDQDSETSAVEDIFKAKCGPFPNRNYLGNRNECDDIAASNPTKELRAKICQEHLDSTDPNRLPQRWCSLYGGNDDYRAGVMPEYVSCIMPKTYMVDKTQPKCARACQGSPGQEGCNRGLVRRPFPIYKPSQVVFNEQCGPFPYTKYGANLATCDDLVTGHPFKEFRMNMCAATLANPTASNPARWCSMYPGNNQSTGTVLPEYARCIKANGMVDMTKPRCANACKGKPGQNGCPGRSLAAK